MIIQANFSSGFKLAQILVLYLSIYLFIYFSAFWRELQVGGFIKAAAEQLELNNSIVCYLISYHFS